MASSEEMISAIQMLPDHVKDTAKEKFKKLSGLAQSATDEMTTATEQIIDKVMHKFFIYIYMQNIFCWSTTWCFLEKNPTEIISLFWICFEIRTIF